MFAVRCLLSLSVLHEALLDVMKLRNGSMAVSLGTSALDELSGVHELINNLMTGVGPNPNHVSSMSHFHKMVLNRTEHFYVRGSKPSSSTGEGIVSGKPALMEQYEHVKAIMTSSKKRGRDVIRALQPLRTYLWCFESEKQKAIKEWITLNVAAIDKSSKHFAIEDDDDDDGMDKALVEYDGAISRTASSSWQTPTAPSTGVKKAKAEKDAAKKAQMLQFFVAPGGD